MYSCTIMSYVYFHSQKNGGIERENDSDDSNLGMW